MRPAGATRTASPTPPNSAHEQRRSNGAPSIAVIIPSYRRPHDLGRCLQALGAQVRVPDQIIVVLRSGDDASLRACGGRAEARLEIVTVERAGQVAALNAGVARARCELVAFTDDDCRPHCDWIARICSDFASDPRVGAVGGRDIIYDRGTPLHLTSRAVGKVTWFGRLVGNHHTLSRGQDVQFLKGANMAYRREILPHFDERLRGDGAQVHNDLKASLDVWSAGWRVIWDPAAVVHHHVAPRADESRSDRSLASHRAEHHNEIYSLVSVRPIWRSVSAVIYAFLVGSRTAPGILLLPWAMLGRSPRRSWELLWAISRGRLEGLATGLRASRVRR